MWIAGEGGKNKRREVVDRRGRGEGRKERRREVVDRIVGAKDRPSLILSHVKECTVLTIWTMN